MKFSEFYQLLGHYRGAKKALAKKIGCNLVEAGYWATGKSAIPLKYWDKIVEATQGHVTEQEIKHEQIERTNSRSARPLSERRRSKQGNVARAVGGVPDRAEGLPVLAERLPSLPAWPQGSEGREGVSLSSDQLCESAPPAGVSATIAKLLEGIRQGEGTALQAAIAACSEAEDQSAISASASGAYVD